MPTGWHVSKIRTLPGSGTRWHRSPPILRSPETARGSFKDEEAFECTAKLSDVKPVDMLYIDSAGDLTVSKNADLTVKRNRFTSLTPAEAAMALHTLQAFAPSGGAGNRTSMRGGGPMTTLVQPRDEDTVRFPLWRLIFANVLPGRPSRPRGGEERSALAPPDPDVEARADYRSSRHASTGGILRNASSFAACLRRRSGHRRHTAAPWNELPDVAAPADTLLPGKGRLSPVASPSPEGRTPQLPELARDYPGFGSENGKGVTRRTARTVQSNVGSYVPGHLVTSSS